jgi:hypothetical protein
VLLLHGLAFYRLGITGESAAAALFPDLHGALGR